MSLDLTDQQGGVPSGSDIESQGDVVARFVLDGTACVIVPQAKEISHCCLGRFEISGRRYAIVQVATEPQVNLLELLTPRELEIALLIAAGQESKAVARRLRISFHTVRVHIARIYCKLGFHKQTELAALISAKYGVVAEANGGSRGSRVSAMLAVAMCGVEQWQGWMLVSCCS